MADISSLSVPISVEQVVHAMLLKVLQDISDKYGLQVRHMHIDWTDGSSLNTPKYIATQIDLSTFASLAQTQTKK